MNENKEFIKRMPVKITPNPKRVICMPFNDAENSIQRIYDLVNKLDEKDIKESAERIKAEFSWRHRNFEKIISLRFEHLKHSLPSDCRFSKEREIVFAAYFLMEYSIEAAALFNPSIVLHPDQSSAGDGSARFIMSLRAAGEGHISSIEFMTGEADSAGNINLDEVCRFAETPKLIKTNSIRPDTVEITFDPQTQLCERVVFPVSADESNGIEDVRFVRFEEAGEITYFGTFTAYDGSQIKSKLIETKDFLHFKIHTMHGAAIKDKGMALFPRKVNGRYTMISRQDGDNIRIMFSDDLFTWDKSDILKEPELDWEFVKIGNIGSPLETDQGWLLLTHGVGAMRKYVIGACLLDKENPAKVIAQLKNPLISPNEEEREGYVPNVVYSCGGIIHNGILILPYAMSDSVSGFASGEVSEILKKMQ